EGETVTLKTNWTEIKTNDIILWTFGTEGTRIARLLNNEIFIDEKFRDRLQLNSLTGSLIISNIRTTDTGLYKVVFISKHNSIQHFSVTVYSVVCSVNNGYRVNLSWYNGSHQHSNISDPDNSTLSLPLNDEHCYGSFYSCVAANPIINQTVQLNTTFNCTCTV
uniref:Si:dkey-102c8.3 n=1 Tax=Astyanax mexicanus TaxID=7994 RepID=W5LGB6_ASTMX